MQSVEAWLSAAQSNDISDRVDAADAPPNIADERVRDQLIRLLSDQESLVRTCAADSLSFFLGDTVGDALELAVSNERDELTRAHMAASLGICAGVDRIHRALQIATESKGRTKTHGLIGTYIGLSRILANELNSQFQTNTDEQGPAVDGFLQVIEELYRLVGEIETVILPLQTSESVLIRDDVTKILSRINCKRAE